MSQVNVAMIVLNWNGKEDSLRCIDSIDKQTQARTIVVIDNGSIDGFADEIEKTRSDIVLLRNPKNLGFAGGVNTGIRWAIQNDFNYVALINNDARPEKTWLKRLVTALEKDRAIGIATGKLLKNDGTIDSTGDQYSTWGLAYPRGRNEKDSGQYDKPELVFAASGGASMYRIDMLREIGLFDEDFFAYYEDVDLSFRAQLAGWKVIYEPLAIAYHQVGATSGKIKGFTTYQTVKNLPWLLWKNVPLGLLPSVWPRFFVAHSAIIASSLRKGAFLPVVKGVAMSFFLFPKKLIQRHYIQKSRTLNNDELRIILTHDLPPNAYKLRRLRGFFANRKHS